jgi:hypothetical protein
MYGKGSKSWSAANSRALGGGLSTNALRHHWATLGRRLDREKYLQLCTWMGHNPAISLRVYADGSDREAEDEGASTDDEEDHGEGDGAVDGTEE